MNTHTQTKAGFTFQTCRKEVKSAKDVLHPLLNISNLTAHFAGRMNSSKVNKRSNAKRKTWSSEFSSSFLLNSPASAGVPGSPVLCTKYEYYAVDSDSREPGWGKGTCSQLSLYTVHSE